jgi:hypothetical protein
VVQFAELVAKVVHDALTILLAPNDRGDPIDLRVQLREARVLREPPPPLRLVREEFVGYPLAPPHSRKKAYEGAHLSPRMA